MKKSLLIVLCLSMSYYLIAQENEKVKQKEIGLVFSNLDNFGLTYKTGTEKSLWRFNTMVISGDNIEETEDSLFSTQNQLGFGVKIGKEYRKNIAENLELRLGADLSFSYSHSKIELDDKTVNDFDRLREQSIYRPGVNLVFGFNYELSDNFVIGAELLPNFTYTTGSRTETNYYTYQNDEENTDFSGFSYGLSNSSALLSLVYRFH
ncbi:MAG: hypothetical protein PF694_13735 [Bacteroidetes bacterium]|jgi:hypothetical protein|nr:hypothetical protein [Bacteroidota bacterium]